MTDDAKTVTAARPHFAAGTSRDTSTASASLADGFTFSAGDMSAIHGAGWPTIPERATRS